MITRRTLFAAAVGSLLLVSCGKSSDNNNGLTVANAWARQSPSATSFGAIYFDITSKDADTLVSVSVPASVAKMAQLHEMVAVSAATDTTMAGGTTDTTIAGGMNGEMVMQHVDKIELPAGATVSLKPGGYHVMLMELAKPLAVGDTIELTLTFGSGKTLALKVPVQETAP